MDEKDLIAYNIMFMRKKLNISQIELAKMLQYSNKNISKWERGETTPSIFTLKQLAEIFEISVDDLVSKKLSDLPIQEQATSMEESLQPQRKLFNISVKLLYLFLANGILLCCTFIAIFILTILNYTVINKWLLLIYMVPLSCISIFIFIACIKKRVDIISISLAGWLTALSIFLTFFQTRPYMWFVFVITAAFQIIIVCIMLIINLKLINRFRRKQK